MDKTWYHHRIRKSATFLKVINKPIMNMFSWSYTKKKYKKIKAYRKFVQKELTVTKRLEYTGNLTRKNLLLKSVIKHLDKI